MKYSGMADADKNLLLSLHEKHPPIDPQSENRVSDTPRASDSGAGQENGTGHGLGVDKSECRMAPTLQMLLKKIPKSPTERGAVLENLLRDRERTFARRTDDYKEKTKILHEERQRLILQQNNLSSTLPPSHASNRMPSALSHWRGTDSSVGHGSSSLGEQDIPSSDAQITQLREAHFLASQKLNEACNGKLGPQSDKPCQVKDNCEVRGRAEEMVERAINKELQLYPSTKEDVHFKAHRERLGQSSKESQTKLVQGRIIQLIMEDLLLQESYNLAELTAQELYCLWQRIRSLSDAGFMKMVESIATGQPEGRDQDDPTYDLVTKAFFSLRQHREKFRPGIWTHSQPTETHGAAASEEEESDVLLLEFDHITPMSIRRTESVPGDSHDSQRAILNWAQYVKDEGLFWKGMTAQYTTINLSKKCKGASIIRPSPNNKLLAIVTAHGDVLIYNMMMTPWQPLRTMHNEKKGVDDPIIDVNWSVTGSHLITINLSGLLHVWRVHGHRKKSQKDNSNLDLSAVDVGVWAEQLGLLLQLNGERQDFNIQTGPLAGAEVHDRNAKLLPDIAVFCPSFTILGSQTYVAVALTNGDILRLDLEMTLREHAELVHITERPSTNSSERPGTNANNNANENKDLPQGPAFNINNSANGSGQVSRPPTHQTHRTMLSTLEKVPVIQNRKGQVVRIKDTIGQGIPAALFRQHGRPVIYLGFINNFGEMISVDEKGYIFVWPFSQESLTTYGWFNPRKKYRISGGKVTYRVAENGQQDVIFTNKSQELTKKQLNIERKRVEEVIKNMGFKDPWHEERVKEKNLITRVYLPKDGVSVASGSMFHVIKRHLQTKFLYTYTMKLYEPFQLKSTKMLGVKQSPSGSELIIILLFPEYPPKMPSLTAMVLDVGTFSLRDYLCNIDLTPQQYSDCLNHSALSMDISQPFGATGTSYMFLNYCGTFVGISLATGSVVMKMKNPKTAEPDYPGLLIAGREIKVLSGTEVSAISSRGKLFLILYCTGEDRKQQSLVQIIEISDTNSSSTRRSVWDSALKWLGDDARHPRDQRLDKVGYILSSEDHVRSWIVELLLRCMDRAIGEVDGQAFTHDECAEFDESDKKFLYTYVIHQLNLDDSAGN